ncbi:MAG TPA: aspartyl protease family protein [Hyphomonadaceae bacterium]|nr:aspartyl protease family protein [Hyphomonadaceae bacterium]
MLSRICWVAMLLAVGVVSAARADPRPFELRDGQVVVMVTIKGHELPALLDTGATKSLIEVGLAQELGIRTQRTNGGTIGASGGRVAFGFTQNRVAIDFGAGPMARYIGTYETSNTFAAEGVRLLIGMDLLYAMVVSLDFQEMTVEIQRSSAFAAPDGEPVILTLGGWLRPTLPVNLAGARADLLIDTAASGSLHLDSSFVASTPALKTLPVTQISIAGIDGVRDRDAILVPQVTFGGHVFENVRASSGPFGPLIDVADMHGVVGVDLLKRFNLVIDFGRHRLWMTPNANSDAPRRSNDVGR